MRDRDGEPLQPRILRFLPGPGIPTSQSDFHVEWDDEFVVARATTPRARSSLSELAVTLACRLERCWWLVRDGTGEEDAYQLSLDLVERGYTVMLLAHPGGPWGQGKNERWNDAAPRQLNLEAHLAAKAKFSG